MRATRMLLRAVGALFLPGVVAALFSHAQACSPSCLGPTREFSGGTRFTSGTDLVYETSPPEGPLLPFEGAAYYHVHHGLGVVPYQISIGLSFNERPLDGLNGGEAPSAGNQTVILSADCDEVLIKNDTCSDFFMRVVVRANPAERADVGNDAACTSAFDAAPTDAPSDSTSDGG